jgi:hypothetical protein
MIVQNKSLPKSDAILDLREKCGMDGEEKAEVRDCAG